ncbi:MAG: transketolase [Lachnospiraceae bacterium]|nr:transketolase [Lachnospiraceae bacterium]MBR0152546.1 transketolase [Lachnospiraceae bacterium]
MANVKLLEEKAKEIRKLTLRCIGSLGIGHIGGSMSICDLLSVLYYDKMNVDPKNPQWADRDRLVVSKGHGGPAVYAALASKGFIPVEELDTLNKPHTNLPSHCDKNRTPGIDMTTGSLGQGFAVAVGMATAAKMDKKPLTVYTIVGDGECQEGQIWESALYAGNRGLDNLIAFVDYNKMQVDGLLENISDLYPLDDKWKSFNWFVQVIDGHDVNAISRAIDNASKVKRPSVIIMHTIKGKGADFCENQPSNHCRPVSEDEWKGAVAALDKED